jgi:DNA primase small subunit
MGSGFDARGVIASERPGTPAAVDDVEAPSRRPSPAFARLPAPDAPGWSGRTSRAVVAMLERFEQEGPEAAARELVDAGLSSQKARHLAKLLVVDGVGRKIRTSLSLDVRLRDLPPEFLDFVVARAALAVQGETDAPVTTDIHRLIRLPGSLHGGTGFRVLPVAPERLEEFDPFVVAFPPVGGDERTVVRTTADVHYPFEPKPLEAKTGEELELADPIALFLLLRGEAELPPSAG